jgi:hypothetical protein
MSEFAGCGAAISAALSFLGNPNSEFGRALLLFAKIGNCSDRGAAGRDTTDEGIDDDAI